MTVIAAAVHPQTGAIAMASDTLSVQGNRTWHSSARKMRRMTTGDGRDFLVAFSGLAAFGSVVHRHLKVDAAPAVDEPLEPWCLAIAETVCSIATEARPPLTNDDDEFLNAVTMLAYRGELWMLNQQNAEPVGGYAAIGCGSDVALGSLYSTEATRRTDPVSRVVEAVNAACRWDSACNVSQTGPDVQQLPMVV